MPVSPVNGRHFRVIYKHWQLMNTSWLIVGSCPWFWSSELKTDMLLQEESKQVDNLGGKLRLNVKVPNIIWIQVNN